MTKAGKKGGSDLLAVVCGGLWCAVVLVAAFGGAAKYTSRLLCAVAAPIISPHRQTRCVFRAISRYPVSFILSA